MASQDDLLSRNSNAIRKRTTAWLPAKPEPVARGTLTTKECLFPLLLVYTMVLLASFANGLMHATNKMIQDSFHVSKGRVAGFDAAGTAAFLVAPLTYGRWCVERFGYRASFIIGLLVQGVGAILFWPFWHIHSFPGLCIANFVAGSSTALLENAVLPYIAGCGPSYRQEMRVMISGGLHSVASILATVTAGYIFYGGAGTVKHSAVAVAEETIKKTKWTYLAVACFIFLLAVVYFFVTVPEIKDEDDPEATDGVRKAPWVGRPFRKQYFLFLGIAAGFFWIGGTGALSSFFMQYAQEAEPRLSNRTAAHYKAISMSFTAVGRFAAAFATKKIKARYILLGCVLVNLSLLAASIGTKGPSRLYIIMAEHLPSAGVGPVIFSLSLRGLGKHTKKGASMLVTCVCALSIFAPVFGVIADMTSLRVAASMTVSTTCLVLIFAGVVNSYLARPLDALCEEKLVPRNVVEPDQDQDKQHSVASSASRGTDTEEVHVRFKGSEQMR